MFSASEVHTREHSHAIMCFGCTGATLRAMGSCSGLSTLLHVHSAFWGDNLPLTDPIHCFLDRHRHKTSRRNYEKICLRVRFRGTEHEHNTLRLARTVVGHASVRLALLARDAGVQSQLAHVPGGPPGQRAQSAPWHRQTNPELSARAK